MTLKTKLQFGDNITGLYNREYNVIGYHGGIGRIYNAFTPQTAAKGTDITVTIASPSKEDLTLHEWFVGNAMMSGRLLFEIMDVNSPNCTVQRSVYFYDAQCVTLKDRYDIHSNISRQLTLVFTPAKVKVEEVSFMRDGVRQSDKKVLNDDDEVDMVKYNKQFDF